MSILSFLRRLKLTYAVYNLFRPGLLKHNVPVYRKYGVRKRYFSPVSSLDFLFISEGNLRMPEELDLRRTALYKRLNKESQLSLDAYPKQGYAVLEGFLKGHEVDSINAEVERLMQAGKLRFRYRNKLTQLILKSRYVRKKGLQPELMELLGVMLRGEARLFHSINFITGSEQHTHSDSIHMTTFPHGGMLGVWFALEDIDEENGPLHYYPGSHKLPYYMNADYDNTGSYWMIGDKDYSEYEAFIAGQVELLGLQKHTFTAKKGDVLIWHANLLHGGNPQIDPKRTRKSMVLHYFKSGVACWHEITQRPALIHPLGEK